MGLMENNTIQTLIDGCWFDTTGLNIKSTDLDEMSDSDDLYIASVIYSGENNGSLTVVMGESLAKELASKMFHSEIEAINVDDIRDSIGELANVLAGNIKTDFFGNCRMAKPVVMYGDDSIISVFKIDAIFQKTFTSENSEELLIQVCQTE